MTRTPASFEVRTLLEDLLGRTVDVGTTAPWLPAAAEPATVAVYADDASRLRSAVVADMFFSAYAATAIALLPGHHARRAIEERTLCRDLRENLTEVLEICAAPQNGPGVPHTTLHRVHHAGERVDPRTAALAAAVGRRLDLTVFVAGYGRGRLSFVTADLPAT
jgi:hypothetical protein